MFKKVFTSLFFVYMAVCGYGENCVGPVLGKGSSKEAALSDALRDSVRQGAGVEIISETATRNMTLELDVIFESCLGYVEEYKILSQGYDQKEKQYWVQIEAKVSKTPLSDNNVGAMKLLVQRKGFPKVYIESKESFNGVPSTTTIADQILQDIAMDMGIKVIAADNLQQIRKQQAAREIVLDNQKRAQRLNVIQTPGYDFKIFIQVEGEISDLYTVSGGKAVRDVGINANMEAFWADTSEMIATMPIQGVVFNGRYIKNLNRNFTMKAFLTKSYLKELLNGTNEEANKQLQQGAGGSNQDDKNSPQKRFCVTEKNARAFFRKILLKWIAELDLGVTTRLEIEKINMKSLNKLLEKLQNTDNISGVRVAVFDVQHISVIEFESRNKQIVDVIAKELMATHNYDHGTTRRLVFTKK